MTAPLTAQQIAKCRAVLDALDDTPRDPWSEEIHARALARARRERRQRPATLSADPEHGSAYAHHLAKEAS